MRTYEEYDFGAHSIHQFRDLVCVNARHTATRTAFNGDEGGEFGGHDRLPGMIDGPVVNGTLSTQAAVKSHCRS